MKSLVSFCCGHRQEDYIYDAGSVIGTALRCYKCHVPRTVTSVSVPSTAEPCMTPFNDAIVDMVFDAIHHHPKIEDVGQTIEQARAWVAARFRERMRIATGPDDKVRSSERYKTALERLRIELSRPTTPGFFGVDINSLLYIIDEALK